MLAGGARSASAYIECEVEAGVLLHAVATLTDSNVDRLEADVDRVREAGQMRVVRLLGQRVLQSEESIMDLSIILSTKTTV